MKLKSVAYLIISQFGSLEINDEGFISKEAP